MALSFRNISRLRAFQKLFHHKFIFSDKFISHSSTLKLKKISRSYYSTYAESDPATLFFSAEVQDTLKGLTGLNIDKIFKYKHLDNPDLIEEYKFLTKEDLQERVEKSLKEARRLLQMPPVVQERKPISEVLSFDPAIQGNDASKLVVTDISYGVSDRERIIVVREPNGVLRQASWEERDRMNQIYNPRPGRYLKTPPIFEDHYVKEVLNKEDYTFLLDFACAHFEPDDPLYHQVTQKTYEHIQKRGNYDHLHSTRHFGPMCFFFAWNKKIDNLAIHYIQEERMEDCAKIIKLYYLIHNIEESKIGDLSGENLLSFISKYIEEDSVMKSNLQLALQSYRENLKRRENYISDVKASHGN